MHKYHRREKKVSNEVSSKTRRYPHNKAVEVTRPATSALEARTITDNTFPTNPVESSQRPATAIVGHLPEDDGSRRVESRCSSALPGPERRRLTRRASPNPDDQDNQNVNMNDGWNDGEDARSKISESDLIDILNGEDMDTDLEMEEDDTIFDHTGRALYLTMCRRSGVIPANFFLRHMNDETLTMRHHGLGPAGVRPICTALMGNSRVRDLDFSDNWLGKTGGIAVAEMLRENCFITHVTLVDNQLGAEVAEKLAEAITVNAQISHLNLRGNFFNDSAAESLAEIITNTVRLEVLNLSHNHLGDLSGTVIGHALSENNTITDLDLSWNHISGRGATGLAKGLSVNTTIVKFNAGWNAFGPVGGVQEIGKCLRLNTTLEDLDLSNNRITPEGAVLFGKGLSGNSTLKTLKIGKNPMQSAGCFAILTSVMRNPESAIRTLSFQDIAVNEDFRELEQRAKEMFSDLKISVGLQIPTRPKAKVHPLIRLINFKEKHNMKFIDFFRRFDKDGNMTLSHEEFMEGLQSLIQTIGIKMTDEDVAWLIRDLDKDGDGEINYGELVLSKAEFEESERKSKYYNSRFRETR